MKLYHWKYWIDLLSDFYTVSDTNDSALHLCSSASSLSSANTSAPSTPEALQSKRFLNRQQDLHLAKIHRKTGRNACYLCGTAWTGQTSEVERSGIVEDAKKVDILSLTLQTVSSRKAGSFEKYSSIFKTGVISDKAATTALLHDSQLVVQVRMSCLCMVRNSHWIFASLNERNREQAKSLHRWMSKLGPASRWTRQCTLIMVPISSSNCLATLLMRPNMAAALSHNIATWLERGRS